VIIRQTKAGRPIDNAEVQRGARTLQDSAGQPGRGHQKCMIVRPVTNPSHNQEEPGVTPLLLLDYGF